MRKVKADTPVFYTVTLDNVLHSRYTDESEAVQVARRMAKQCYRRGMYRVHKVEKTLIHEERGSVGPS